MKKDTKKHEPKVVARYGSDYEITKGVPNGMHYGFHDKEFIGSHSELSHVISLISIREGQNFNINKVKIL